MDKDDRRGEEPLEFREAAPAPSSIAGMIGTKNLLIIIVTMPFVFLMVVMAIIAVFGSPDEGEAAPTAGAVVSTPVASLEQPAIEGSRVVLPLPAAAGDLSAAITLPEGAATSAMALDGDRLALRVDTDAGAMIVIYDLSTDQVVKTIPLVAANDG